MWTSEQLAQLFAEADRFAGLCGYAKGSHEALAVSHKYVRERLFEVPPVGLEPTT